MSSFSDLKGKTLSAIDKNTDGDGLYFTCTDGSKYKMFHFRDCCESVYLADVCGDFEDILNSPILVAEQNSNSENADVPYGEGVYKCDTSGEESITWTFYKLATIKGYVDLRWVGRSNGHYSESVDFVLVGSDEDYYR